MTLEQRKTLAEQRRKEKDPAQREAYALAERAGFDWYDTESAARRMAQHAGEDIVKLQGGLKEANKLLDALIGHLEWTGWGDRYERECSQKLRDSIDKRRAAIREAAILKKVQP